MKKHLLILAGLSIMTSAVFAAESTEQVKQEQTKLQKDSQQQRGAKFSACRAQASQQGLSGQAMKDFMLTCTK